MGAKIYDKATRELMYEFVEENQIEKGQIFEKIEIIDWFSKKYPKTNIGTVNIHIIRMTANNEGRTSTGLRTNGEDDLFFKTDDGKLRLYGVSPAFPTKPTLRNLIL